jgi:chaperonin GroEL
MSMKRGIDRAVSDTCKYIKGVAIPVKGNSDIENVARISSNGDDEIAKVIAEAVDKVGTDGIINVAESKSMDTYLTTVDGMQFNRGYLSPYFVNNQQSGECILEDCQILMTDKAIKTWTEIMPALQLAMNSGKPLLIMADGIEPEVLRVLILNVIKNNLSVCAIAAPGYAEIRRSNLEDIAILTNGKVIAEELGTSLDKITADCFGRAQKVIVGRDTTTIIGGAGDKDAVEDQVNKIRLQISQLTTNDDVAIDRYKKRIARLTSGVAIINVGGNSDAEVREKMDRIDDALRSTKAATEEGIVPGGSTVYINSLHELNCILTANDDVVLSDDELAGYQIVINAIKYPLKAICENAGKSGDTVINKVFDESDPNYGYNAACDEYCDMINCGIIEPAKISRVALQNAASAAGMLLTSRCAIVNDRVDPEKTITLDGDALMGR